MVSALLLDFSRVLLFPNTALYLGELNKLHQDLKDTAEYEFFEHFQLNEELLSLLDSLQNKVALYIFTSGTIQNVPELKPRLEAIFRQIFSAAELGLSKKDPQSFLTIAQKIGKKPEEILFIDDSPANIAAAKTAGLQTHLYQGFAPLRQQIENLLKTNP